jgi:hypothetical protein
MKKLQRSIYWKKELYHNNFVVDKDSGCLLQGWKGRIIHALSFHGNPKKFRY